MGKDGGLAVTKCVCHEVGFDELLRMAREQRLSLADLKERTGCCTGCGTCEPYVRKVLLTGRVVLPILSPGEVDALMNLKESSFRPFR